MFSTNLIIEIKTLITNYNYWEIYLKVNLEALKAFFLHKKQNILK